MYGRAAPYIPKRIIRPFMLEHDVSSVYGDSGMAGFTKTGIVAVMHLGRSPINPDRNVCLDLSEMFRQRFKTGLKMLERESKTCMESPPMPKGNDWSDVYEEWPTNVDFLKGLNSNKVKLYGNEGEELLLMYRGKLYYADATDFSQQENYWSRDHDGAKFFDDVQYDMWDADDQTFSWDVNSMISQGLQETAPVVTTPIHSTVSTILPTIPPPEQKTSIEADESDDDECVIREVDDDSDTSLRLADLKPNEIDALARLIMAINIGKPVLEASNDGNIPDSLKAAVVAPERKTVAKKRNRKKNKNTKNAQPAAVVLNNNPQPSGDEKPVTKTDFRKSV
jgi:hypothetical protein